MPPPPLPEPRPVLTESDLLFAERIFGSLAARREEIQARAALATGGQRGEESRGLTGPERKLLLLREELFQREAQLLRLGDLWRRMRAALHSEKERGRQQEELIGQLRSRVEFLEHEARHREEALAAKEEEIANRVSSLEAERVVQEKALIEVVAAKEREASLLKREVAEREAEVERLQAEIAKLREARRRQRAAAAGPSGGGDGDAGKA